MNGPGHAETRAFWGTHISVSLDIQCALQLMSWGLKSLWTQPVHLTQYLFEISLGQPSPQRWFVVVEPLLHPPPKHGGIPEDRFTSCPGFKFHSHF